MGVSAFAQPTFDEKLDAKQIFFQNFEAGWDEWSTTPIDSITVLEYYDHQGADNGTSFKPWSDPENWKKGIIRTDSTMILYNGIKPTDDPNEMPDKNNNFPNEVYGTVKDIDAARTEAMSTFGEADKGGDYVLSYTSDTCTLAAQSWGTYKGGYTANYRRNLFVRGLPIEDSTSYRLTFYIKANRVAGHNRAESKPRLSAGVFRGFYHAEKPFSMGIENDNNNNKYNAQFEYTKDEFTGEWEKINLMTYYINDSIANNFVFVDGYWWASGDWTWKASSTGSSNPKDYDLNYIVQPDKFFVRLGFISDYTEFKVDNLSLTKSWIAGCEYDNDKMRVDFGYKTNLGALAKAAYEKNKIDAVEVVNTQNKYVDVWGQKADNSWERVPINSIEYHGDGYMYLFTPSRVVNGQTVKVQFKSYKQVLVTFRNPVDQPELALKYTGKGNSATEGFPMGTDTAWIKAGKVVPNFYNELATPNPNIFDGVYSMKELPPVMQESEFEEGSFGLDPSTRTLWFKYSREVAIDANNPGDESNMNALTAYVGSEVWIPSWDAENSRVVLTRPEGKTAPLAGDVEIEMVKIYGIGTAKAENVTVNYHFGSYDRKPDVFSKTTDWKSQVTGTSRPYPTSVYVHSGTDPFKKGDGANSPGKCGLYNMNGDGQYNAGFYLSSRNGDATGNMYSIETLQAGDYTISFRALGWGSNNKALTVKLYAKPAGELVDGNANGFAVLEAVQDKTIIGKQEKWDANISSAGDWKEGYVDLSYNFTIPANGDYVFEFFTDGSSNYEGVIFSNYAIKSYAGLPGLCTVPLNESVDAAKARIALAKGENDADLAVNGGSIYDALVEKLAFYNYDPEGGFKANGAYPTNPTAWKNAKKELDDATNLLKLRMDTVKTFTDKRAAVAAKLEANATVADLSTYKLLQAKADTANAYPVTTKGGKEIYAFNDRMQKAIDALDARLALNKKLSDELTKANNLIEDTEAKKDFEEYTELQAAYNANKDCDLINSLDDAINATYDAVHSAIYDYQFRVLRLQYATVRMHKLDSIAAKLGSDIVDNETVKAGLAAIEEDDPALAAIYISAIKIALYEKLDTDNAIYDEDSLDITPFISNYNLYQTPNILEKMDLQMPKNSGDMAVIGPKGENMLHTRHQYNENGNMPIWVIVPEQDITDLYPGWTVRAFRTGNTMVTGDKSYNNYKNAVPVFDGEIGMDWNCKAELKQDLANLPVGLYTLGVELPEIKNNGSDKVITLKGNDKSAVMNDKNATVGALTIDSIAVTDSLKIDLVVMSENGWSRADNFTLAFRPDKSFEYGDAIAAEQANLTELLTIVNSAKAVAANVEYFTLGGVQVAAPKAGQILIRKTTNANGKVVTDKVLLK